MSDQLLAMLTAGIGGVFAIWLLATIPHQFRWRAWDVIARHDRLGLLPRWTFFAPNPGRHDLHIIYRDWAGAVAGPWQEYLGDPAGTPCRWLWNPDRFVRKAVVDMGNAVARSAAMNGPDDIPLIQLEPAYLQILRWVSGIEPTPGAEARQFALVRTQTTSPGRPLDVVFVSFEHRLPRR